MEVHVLGKRTSLACEPCRRKKVKCSGERPKCTFCARLGQTCDYRSDAVQLPQARWTDNRIDEIMVKLDELLFLNRSNAGPSNHDHANTASEPNASCAVNMEPTNTSSRSINHPPAASPGISSQEIGEKYQTWCHNQPLYLFRQDDFLESVQYRDTEVRLAMQVLGSRFPPCSARSENKESLDNVLQTCRRMVTDRVTSGTIKLSTLQTLCLLSLISFRDGKFMQAGLDSTMAQYFAKGLPDGSSLGDPFEYSLCVQAIAFLHCTQECVGEVSKASQLDCFSKQSTSRDTQSSRITLLREPGRELDPGLGILPYAEQAAEVWHMARIYAASAVGSDETPPWDPRSDYSHIMLRFLDLDTVFPLRYRFARSNFSTVSLESLQRRRDYWGPWFFIQFIHHAVPCLLNHPFLLSMRLKNYKRLTPQTFIHQCFDELARHTAWVICFIDLVEKQEFLLSDPVIAHCVTIVATIHLQHSFVVDESLRERAQKGYNKCTKFLERMSTMWPIISSMAQNLTNLRDSVTTVEPATQHQQIPETNGPWSIDAQLLWDVLIYEKACRHSTTADRSMYGEGVVLQAQHREQDVNDHALVGSAGISGHKTVPREISAYAPEVNEDRHGLNGSEVTPVFIGDETGLGYGQISSDMQLTGQFIYDQDRLLQPEDFQRAFNSWFDVGMN